MRKILILLSMIVALSGCYETTLHMTDHPNEAAVDVQITLPTDSNGESVADEMTIIFDGEEYALNADGTFDPGLLYEGSYTYYVYNDPAGESGDDSKSTVSYDSATGLVIASIPAIDDNGNIATDADQLYFGQNTISVSADTATVTSSTMDSLVGVLNFKLLLEGDAISKLVGISTTLNGVAQHWDCINDAVYGSSASVLPSLTLTTSSASASATRSGDDSYYLEGSVSLLGVVEGESQILTIELEYEDLNPAAHSFESDVTSYLADFNSDKTTAVTLTNTVETPSAKNPSGTIGDWNTTKYPVLAE